MGGFENTHMSQILKSRVVEALNLPASDVSVFIDWDAQLQLSAIIEAVLLCFINKLCCWRFEKNLV